MGFLESLGNTLKSIGGATIAPAGLAFDLATMPFDNKDDDFGSVLSAAAHRAGDVFDPLSNSNTWTGFGVGKTMEGLTYAYKEGVDRPLGTALLEVQHATSKNGDVGSLFSGDDWAKAYGLSKNQSLGQSAMVGLADSPSLMTSADPFEKGTTFANSGFTKDHPFLANAGALGIDLATSWYLDPGVVAGKGAMVLRAKNLGKLKNIDKLDFESKLAGNTAATGVRSQDWAGRYDKYESFIQGDNHLKRPLNAAEIYAASPELQRSAQGRAIAGLMDDANKLPDASERTNTLRRIIAVGAGDPSQIERVKQQSANAQSIADALGNVAQQTTPRLHLQALKDDVRLDPTFNAEFSRQLDNLNSDGEVDNFVKDWSGRVKARLDANQALLDTGGRLKFVPGAHGIKGNRALRRETGDSLGERVATAHNDTIDWARKLANRESYTGVFQKSLYHMPLIVAHPVGLLAAPYTKGVAGAVDALRTTRFNGVANLHDWNGAADQLNSMMRIAGVDDSTRLAHLSDAYKASSEADKLKTIHRVENLATSALADRMSEKVGRKIDPGFIQEITARGQSARAADTARTDGGRIYAATQAPEGMASDLTERAATKTGEAQDARQWRVDQIPDENGLPLSLPLTVSQLSNRVPLFDIHLAKKLTSDSAWTERFAKLSDTWTTEARDLTALQGQLKRSGAKGVTLLSRAVDGKRATLDALAHTGSIMTRWWKYSVLMRLGYPMRVLMDDHMRIAAQMHWTSFALHNTREGMGNTIFNNAPAMIYSGGRKAAARQAFTVARARRAELVTHFGRDAHSDTEWMKLKSAIDDGDTKTIQALDPDGRVAEHYETTREVQKLASSVTGHKAAIRRWKTQIEDAQTKHALGLEHGIDIPGTHKKIQEAEAAILDKDAGRAHLLDQLGDDPEALRKELVELNSSIDKGAKGFHDPKRHLGENPVKLDDNLLASGVYGADGGMYRLEAGSQEHYDQLLTDGEESSFALISSGAHRSIAPQEPGHAHVWANVLNHQFLNSPELMAFIKGKVNTPEEFATWLAEPKQAYVRNRMQHYAADPHDWGSRLQELAHDYVPNPEVRDALLNGKVTARQLNKLVPEGERPVVHGQLADVNSGRHTATRMTSAAFNRVFRLLSETPTDNLSRHPYMNAVYKQELRDLYAVKKAHYANEGRDFTQDDLYDLERAARQNALAQLKQSLWDVSAHSHGAHVMRFLSPFFAAHQEALTRWWRIASDDPSVVRRFQLAFDAPRKAGMVYDSQTGELVEPGEGISTQHAMMLRVPFASDNSAVNKWVKKMGGGKYWHVNENGFNLILQNGIANPGVGPVVTVPMEAMVNRYAGDPQIEKMARALNPYPPDSPMQAVMPAWAKRAQALVQKQGNKEWNSRYQANLADAVIRWRTDNGESVPTSAQFDALADRAAHDTNRDIGLMLLSNLTSPLPSKPDSKYAVVQHGISQIMSQMRSGGHDFAWAREQVSQKYGDVYTALLYSQTNNKAGLSQNYAEVNAIKRYKGVLSKTDPTMARMVIGPAAAMDAEADPGLKQYSASARRFLLNEKVNSHSTETYLSSKEPDEAAVSSLISAGWSQYEELTNWLQVQAEAKGLKTYDDDPTLVKAKSAGLAYLLKSNYAWAHEWNSFDHGAGYTEKLDDMRQIANDKQLTGDPTRSDVHWLGQYLALRDTIQTVLDQRKAAGGSGGYQAKANSDLMQAFAAGVKYIRQQNTLFDQYDYHGQIERDPWLTEGGN